MCLCWSRVRALMRALDGKEQGKSHAAAVTLSEIGEPAVEALSSAFLSSRDAARRGARADAPALTGGMRLR